jgi:uncharacterized phage protein gp47/JayE
MSFVRKTYQEITDSILSQITKGIVNERYDFVPSMVKYRLKQPKILDIVRVDGTVRNAPNTFLKGTDYRFTGGMLEWIAEAEQPDAGTSFYVNYIIDAPRTITDINPGSVTRTLVESVALEIDYLYAQLDQVYKLAFIDTAYGKALDLVASILGIVRKPAGFATGEVTFGRKGDMGEIQVKGETFSYDGRPQNRLKQPFIKAITLLEGTSEGAKVPFSRGTDFLLSDNAIEWIADGKKPDQGSPVMVDYTSYQQVIIPADTRVTNYTRIPENLKVFRTARDATLARAPDGIWAADVPVVALNPGRSSNVFAGSITVMAKPPLGVEYVINKHDILNGTNPETDEELRERAKRALEMAGKATLIALKSAIEGIEGVTGEVKVFDQPDGIPGIVQIIASGGSDEVIRQTIDETRAAGIHVEFKRPVIVPLDVALTLKMVEGIDQAKVRDEVEKGIRNYLGSLEINETVVLNRIIQAALSVQGVRDVKDVTINKTKGNVDIRMDERGDLRILELFVED